MIPYNLPTVPPFRLCKARACMQSMGHSVRGSLSKRKGLRARVAMAKFEQFETLSGKLTKFPHKVGVFGRTPLNISPKQVYLGENDTKKWGQVYTKSRTCASPPECDCPPPGYFHVCPTNYPPQKKKRGKRSRNEKCWNSPRTRRKQGENLPFVLNLLTNCQKHMAVLLR